MLDILIANTRDRGELRPEYFHVIGSKPCTQAVGKPLSGLIDTLELPMAEGDTYQAIVGRIVKIGAFGQLCGYHGGIIVLLNPL